MKEPLAGLRSAEVIDDDLLLTLNNSMAAIEDGRQAILRYIEPRALDARVINRMEVIFEEVISNIVRHGFSADPAHTIVVRLTPRQQALEFIFEDDGAPFDPLVVAEPAPMRSLDTVELGGLGIALVKKLVACIRYEALRQDESAAFQPNNRLLLSLATA